MKTATNQAQDDFGGGDDAGGGGEEMMDMESMGLDSGGGANKLSGQVEFISPRPGLVFPAV